MIVGKFKPLWEAVVLFIAPKTNLDKVKFMPYPTKPKAELVHTVQAPPDPRIITQVRIGDQVAILAPSGEPGEWDNLAFAIAGKNSNLTPFDMKALAALKLKYDIQKYEALKPFYAAGLKPKDVAPKFMVDGKPQIGYSKETLEIIWRTFNKARMQQSVSENKAKQV